MGDALSDFSRKVSAERMFLLTTTLFRPDPERGRGRRGERQLRQDGVGR